jgi:hypothetical protein
MQNLSWTTFVDPFENAFSISVPVGWRVTGGMLRRSPIDPSICMRLISPDLRTTIILGDPEVGIYLTPQPTLFGGLSPGGLVPSRPYVSGMDFARDYVLGALAKAYDNVALIDQKPRPDLAQGGHVRFNPTARHDGGEATFTCRQGGEAAWGFIGADTYIYGWPMQGGVLWGVGLLLGFVAPAEGVAMATDLLHQIPPSARIDPAWLQRQTQANEDYARGVLNWGEQMRAAAQANVDRTTRILDGISHAQREAVGKTQADSAALQQQMDEIVSGYSDYADSAGNVYKLDNTKDYHFADGLGQTLSTNYRDPPGLNWSPLAKVPPGKG